MSLLRSTAISHLPITSLSTSTYPITFNYNTCTGTLLDISPFLRERFEHRFPITVPVKVETGRERVAAISEGLCIRQVQSKGGGGCQSLTLCGNLASAAKRSGAGEDEAAAADRRRFRREVIICGRLGGANLSLRRRRRRRRRERERPNTEFH